MAGKEEGGALSPLVEDGGEDGKARDTSANAVDAQIKMLTLVGSSLEDV